MNESGRQAADEIGLTEFVDAVRSSRMQVAAFTASAVAITTLVAFLMTPVYRASALLAPVTEEPQTGLAAAAGQLADLAALSGLPMAKAGSKQEALALLRSRVLVERFIQEKNLLPVLFADDWDAERNAWDVDADDVPTLGDGYEYFDERIRRVEEDRKTGLVTVSIEWTDRQQAADWAAALVGAVNEYTRQRAIKEAERSLEYLNRELGRTSIVGIQQILYRLIETETKNIMLANVREQYAFRVVDPPSVPDPDDFAKPQRALLILLGLILGLAGGAMLALVRHSWRPGRA